MTDRTYLLKTFGCKLNQYDSQVLRERLEALGLREAAENETPDVCLFNTCTVTHVSDQKVRQAVRQAARQWPRAGIYITGCAAVNLAPKLLELPGVLGVFRLDQWPELLAEIAGEAPRGCPSGVSALAGHARGLLKIQEGCSGVCTYCIVPAVRGPSRSRDLHEILDEAKRLHQSGFEEIVLTGTHIGLFGAELDDRIDLAGLFERLLDDVPRVRFRISSLEIVELTEDLLDVMSASGGRVCPHLHLPLQSGDPRILRAMKRPYTPADFLEAVDRARARLDEPALTTDVIVGFPGETEESFGNTLGLCRHVGFSRLHVFPFSSRDGTLAAEMPGQPHSADVTDWTRRLRAFGEELGEQFARRWVGRRVEVVPERVLDDGRAIGYTERYVKAAVPEPAEIAKRLRVRAHAYGDGRLQCR